MTTIHILLPGDVDDPRHPSGGNVYDREVCTGLTELGWTVREHPVSGSWPHPEPEARAHLATVLGAVPDHSVVLMDGLLATAAPTQTAVAGGRLRLVVLAHMVGAHQDAPAERSALTAASAVIATSAWTRGQLIGRHPLPAERVHVAEPGVHPAELGAGSAAGGRLLCVGAVSHAKGHDILLHALASIRDLPWRCTCVGPLDRDPGAARPLPDLAEDLGLAARVTLTGPLVGADLDEQYAHADLLVHPTRTDAYAMVVTESLARGVPVLASDVGGVPLAMGRGPDGDRPGVLVPPGDGGALALALRRWLADADRRERWRAAARGRRATLAPWRETVSRVAHVLSGVADEPHR
ncbi:glycosyltransferase family 4 protein [Janibacter sp. GS2]|uniref:glycosyltransferase family 4 protein n=1 Tax=Janibacter sp. GS2 TaxID=3442646 RepID=UPI003EB93867